MTNKIKSNSYEDLAKKGRMTEAGAAVEGLDSVVGLFIAKRSTHKDSGHGVLSFTWHLKSGRTLVQADDITTRTLDELYIDFTEKTDDQTQEFLGYVRDFDSDWEYTYDDDELELDRPEDPDEDDDYA